jgi:cytochrome c
MRKVLVLVTMLVPLSFGAQAKGDAAAGKKQFAPCSACHTVEKGGPNKIGPNLHGFLGKKAGSNRTDYAYSAAMKNATVVWSEEVLEQYLTKPAGFIPGNKMPFVGIPNPEVRANIIAFLKEATTTE